MESSDGVEPEIDFSPVKNRRYEQYSSELCVLSHKSESIDNLGRANCQRFMACEIVCKLRLENEPHNYGSNNLEQKAVVLLLLTFCLLLLPLWESVIVLCFVVRYFMSILVLQSS